MEGISDLKICGIDEKRPPRVRKEPYIDVIFKLIHQAPKDWCEDFNQLVSKADYTARIIPATGLFIETWVRKPEEIEKVLETLKQAVNTCSLEYIAKINAKTNSAQNSQIKPENEGEQGRLNKIIAALDFDSVAC